jgi:hypothetical protein
LYKIALLQITRCTSCQGRRWQANPNSGLFHGNEWRDAVASLELFTQLNCLLQITDIKQKLPRSSRKKHHHTPQAAAERAAAIATFHQINPHLLPSSATT